MKNFCGFFIDLPCLPCWFLVIANRCRNRITPNNLTHVEKVMALHEDKVIYLCVGLSKNKLLTVPKCFFVKPFCYLCFEPVMLSCLFIVALWSLDGKGLATWLTCMCCFLVFLSLSHVVSWVRCGTWCIDSWSFPSSYLHISWVDIGMGNNNH